MFARTMTRMAGNQHDLFVRGRRQQRGRRQEGSGKERGKSCLHDLEAVIRFGQTAAFPSDRLGRRLVLRIAISSGI